MKISEYLLLLVLLNLHLVAAVSLIHNGMDNERKPYIVYMGELPEDFSSVEDDHHSLLSEAIGDEEIAIDSRIHSYGRSFNGFAARLLPHEVKILSQKESVVSVFPSTVRKVVTTRSWDFLGMPETAKRNQRSESNVIIGLIDTGIWINSASFDDEGLGPPPRKWKGKCQKAANFTGCNNKVIGAQYFRLEEDNLIENLSPVDDEGHGTHTASTAAGVPVKDASMYGLAAGTARGGVPLARIASYKVCWAIGCTDTDLLAAFDAAIADGVDIISVSMGGVTRKYFRDPMAIGAFHAMKKGILTVCAGGNDGPDPMTVNNVAPWILTVAASSIDRQFETPVRLGDGMTTIGTSVNTYSPEKKMYPLTSGVLAANTTRNYGNVSACDPGTLSPSKVTGKIVYCRGPNGQDSTISYLDGVGTIMAIDDATDTPLTYVIPAAVVNVREGEKIDHYINSTKSPMAVIEKSIVVNTTTAPFVASFSSRGPQFLSPNILKPDISAPGISILAAYSELATVTGDSGDKRIVKFNVNTGTSMACPHVAGAAAYVKSFHPRWSPAAIKSALMTTATPMRTPGVDAELASGSGQINPTGALHPGLVYDADTVSFISLLCKSGYNSTTIALMMGDGNNYNCSDYPRDGGADGLNYPSIHLQLKSSSDDRISGAFHRTVTNVGWGKAVYHAKVTSPKSLQVTVEPNTLSFDQSYEKRTFRVTLKGRFEDNSRTISAELVWTDTRHTVKSAIVVYRPIFDF